MRVAEKIEPEKETALVVFTEAEQKALKEYSITPEEVAEKAKEYMALKVVPDDSESYDKANSARLVCVHTRTGVDKRRKKLNEDDQARIKARNEAAKKLVAPLAPVETYLEKELQIEDGRKAEIKARKAQEELERVQGIRAKITTIGAAIASIQGKPSAEIKAAIDTLSVTPILPTEYQEFEAEANKVRTETMAALLNTYNGRLTWEEEQAKAKAEAERLEAQRKEQEAEAARLAAEKKAQEEAAAKVRAEQAAEAKRLEDLRKAEEEKVRKEREALEAEKRVVEKAKEKARMSSLYAIGLVFDGEQFRYEDVNVHWTEAVVLSDSDFEALVLRLKPVVENRKAALEQYAKEKAETAARAKVEREEQERKEKEAKAEAERLAKEEADRKEAERKAALLPDREKLAAYFVALYAVPKPGLFFKKANNILDELTFKMEAAIFEAEKATEAL